MLGDGRSIGSDRIIGIDGIVGPLGGTMVDDAAETSASTVWFVSGFGGWCQCGPSLLKLVRGV
jgi:hypothetical protein